MLEDYWVIIVRTQLPPGAGNDFVRGVQEIHGSRAPFSTEITAAITMFNGDYAVVEQRYRIKK